jgi:hypothetical protein
MIKAEVPANPQKLSAYERVLADPEARDAYFNTTRAHLFGDPNASDVVNAIEHLENASIAFLFTPDEDLARPILQTELSQFVGAAQIHSAIGMLAIHDSQRSAA